MNTFKAKKAKQAYNQKLTIIRLRKKTKRAWDNLNRRYDEFDKLYTTTPDEPKTPYMSFSKWIAAKLWG